MRHLKRGRKLKRNSKQRKALLKNLVRDLILKNRIKTTEAKAKEARSFAEKIITRAKTDNVASRRLIKKIMDETTLKHLFEKIAPRYKNRQGGYSRIVKLGRRMGDGAKEAIIELI
ncbi:MAG: 50S ribosomal protein L17 [Candidatus Niyogibacteria bacterium RIFCSPLOWO2_12_FULL_41_13]|uniref:Large ribosomal subunit protein bL17 n=1 Tax=Candidatus Niyogibacteria bacterium RIFCSPLOWO2_12_FULL_41_13 TaxID=1801726 RepID=A0A1G2F2H3_9BACT|nr:MAG: 50S ribosomal protein L17 [Candidatus Niyogibacteria bacterium RIFCSPLOWO2_12_FULL_41_13]